MLFENGEIKTVPTIVERGDRRGGGKGGDKGGGGAAPRRGRLRPPMMIVKACPREAAPLALIIIPQPWNQFSRSHLSVWPPSANLIFQRYREREREKEEFACPSSGWRFVLVGPDSPRLIRGVGIPHIGPPLLHQMKNSDFKLPTSKKRETSTQLKDRMYVVR